jgi:hypothetical protein
VKFVPMYFIEISSKGLFIDLVIGLCKDLRVIREKNKKAYAPINLIPTVSLTAYVKNNNLLEKSQ